MLVITRRQDDAFVLGGSIVVRVVHVDGNKVRIGITAPKDIAVLRDDVFDRLHGDGATRELEESTK